MSARQILWIDNQEYEVARMFGADRAIINYGGLFVLVDRDPETGWDLSGDPATPEEAVVIEELIVPTKDKSILTITKVDS